MALIIIHLFYGFGEMDVMSPKHVMILQTMICMQCVSLPLAPSVSILTRQLNVETLRDLVGPLLTVYIQGSSNVTH